MRGDRYSVAPKVLERRGVLAINERCAMKLVTAHGPLFLVLVGALNVGRIRVVGVEPTHAGPLIPPRRFARGAELARFEMGSTIVLIAPPRATECAPSLKERDTVKLGSPIGRWLA
jgi:phosphatidylserine decarboxylase